MFGNDDNKQLPANDFSNISLPQQQPTTPQFASPANNDIPGTAPTAPLQDLSIPEITETSTPDTPQMPTLNSAESAPSDDLTSLKQQALSQLSPLINKLEQTPEEKFRTTMMMIQASDDQTLLKSAYEAAQQITDEKVKAQALLDVINEINYFAQKNNSN